MPQDTIINSFDILWAIRFPPPSPQPLGPFPDLLTGRIFLHAWPRYQIAVDIVGDSTHKTITEPTTGAELPLIISTVPYAAPTAFAVGWRYFRYEWDRFALDPWPTLRALHVELSRTIPSDRSAEIPLTDRETLVLELLAWGQSYQAISREIGRTPRTVYKIVAQLKERLFAPSTPSMLARAAYLGLIPVDRLFRRNFVLSTASKNKPHRGRRPAENK